MNGLKNEIADLRVFSDPFSEANFKVSNGGWHADFERRGKKIALRRDADGKIYSQSGEGLIAGNFRSLLASADFSNIKFLSQALIHEYGGLDDEEMDVPFEIDGNKSSLCNFEQVDKFLSSIKTGSVIGLEGPAGSGKTHLIERLTKSRAKKMKMGIGGEALIIPVRSLGKVLSAIDDRIEGTLQALKASFTRSELPVLMKNGLISLAIDGFDELSDSRGYDNSWSALRELLKDVGGQGLVILSGRDSFIDKSKLQELVGKTIELAGSSLHSISVGFPTPAAAIEWLCRVNSDWHSFADLAAARLSTYSWLRRPFFITQISKVNPQYFLETEDEPIVAICREMVKREVEKLRLPEGISEFDGENIVYSILTEVARTMMDYEVDYVDLSLLEIAVEVACDQYAPSNLSFSRALAARAKTLTFLEPAPGTGDVNNRKFAHEKIKAFFYSSHLVKDLPNSSSAPLGLRRSNLTLSDLSVFSAFTRSYPGEAACSLRAALVDAIRSSGASPALNGNLCSLLIAILPEAASENDKSGDIIELSHSQLIDAVFPDRPIAILKDIYVNRLDARGSNLAKLEFLNCDVNELIVSADTRFGKSIPNISCLILESDFGSDSRLHREEDIYEKISSLTEGNFSEEETILPETLDILVRLIGRGYWVKLSRDDKRGRKLLERADWDHVRNVLEEHDLLEKRNIGVGGKPADFIHLKNSDVFLKPERWNDSVREVISQLRVNGLD